MEKKWRVVFVGDSLLIAGAATALVDKPDLDIFQTDLDDESFRQDWLFHRPDLVVFDCDYPLSAPFLSLLVDQPGTLLIGLDLACRRAVVLNSQPFATTTMNKLYQLILTVAKLQDCRLEGGRVIDRNEETAVYQNNN